MDVRWSLENKKNNKEQKDISFEQFQDIVKNFKTNAEDAFGKKCILEISALNAPKEYTTFMDDFIHDILKEQNKEKELLQTGNISDVTSDIWNKAKYVEIRVLPKENGIGFGRVEFKGNQPSLATFGVNGEKTREQIKEKFSAQYPEMVMGDGWSSHGNRCTLRPAGLTSF